VRGFDRDTVSVHSPTSFQSFLTCLKEISGAWGLSANPFLGNWHHPQSQLAFLTQIIATNPVPVVFPKPCQIVRTSGVLVGDFRTDHWHCVELIESLVYLCDFSPAYVDAILRESIEKGTALLLLVLAQTGAVSRFAEHLVQLLLHSQPQYISGFTMGRQADFDNRSLSLPADRYTLL
jgi:hypothetical protein